MTSPQPPAPPDGLGAETTIAIAALGLALVAIESRIRAEIVEALEALATSYLAIIAAVLFNPPGTRHKTGTELLSQSDVHKRLVDALTTARENLEPTIAGGYTAGAHLARIRATRQLKKLGHEVPADLNLDSAVLDDLLDDVQTAFTDAQTDMQNGVRDAFDGVTGDDASKVTAARHLTIRAAVRRVIARLRQRINAAAAVGVHRGARDTQQAIFQEFRQVNPYIRLRKRWKVTASDPCGMCAALDGTIVDIDAEFDHEANSGTERTRPVFGDLLGPPRHPNCRCQVELVTG